MSIEPSLGDDPSQNYTPWVKSVRKLAASLFADPSAAYGLLHLVTDPIIFATYPRNFEANGDPIPPPNPRLPDPIAGNAGSGTTAMYKHSFDRAMHYITDSNTLRNSIIDSIGTVLQRDQTDPLTDTITHDIPTIFNNMRVLFGTETRESLRHLHSILDTPIQAQDMATFLDFSSTFVETLNKLTRAGHPIDSYSQMEKFTAATSAQPGIVKAIDSYMVTTPLLADRTVQLLITYIRGQLANITTSHAGFASNAMVTMTQAEYQALVSTGAVASNAAAPAAKSKPSATNPFYCYYHGYKKHLGSTCSHMLANTTKFTPAMLKSKSPTEVAGGHK